MLNRPWLGEFRYRGSTGLVIPGLAAWAVRAPPTRPISALLAGGAGARAGPFHQRTLFPRADTTTSTNDVGDVRHFCGIRSAVAGDLLNESSEVIRFDESHDRLEVVSTKPGASLFSAAPGDAPHGAVSGGMPLQHGRNGRDERHRVKRFGGVTLKPRFQRPSARCTG